MRRRTFLQFALSVVMASAIRGAARAETIMPLKGFHLTTGFDASVVNLLGANWWCGTDEVFRVIRDPAQQAQFLPLQGEYVARIPHDMSVPEVQAIQQLPPTLFKNSWIVMNEPDLANFTHQYTADRVTEAITNIQAADPTRNNKVMLCAGSQYAGTDYVQQVMMRIPLHILDKIDGLAWHYYPQADPSAGGIYDESRLRNFLNLVCPFTAAQGFNKAWLSEFGWDAKANPERIINRLPRFVSVMNEFPILKRFNFYAANVPEYTRMVNGTGITQVGACYAGI